MQRKTRWLVIGILAFAALLLFFVWRLSPRDPSRVVVRRNGTIISDLSLAQDGVFPFDNDGHHNVLIIEGGRVWMAEANCADQLCLSQGAMDAHNIPLRPLTNTIICLPHQLTISLE